MNNKKLTLLSLISLTAASCISMVGATFAWIMDSNKIEMNRTTGYTLGAYFARGNGTEEEPYIINAPIHLYNLAWLQEMGKFNELENGHIETTYFKMEDDLDVTGTVYEKLPPIGTQTYPFLGSFDGDGHTIKGLKTCNVLGSGENEIFRKPSLVESLDGGNIIGLFGVVGSYEGSPAEATYDTSANEVKNFTLKNYTVASKLNSTLCGAVAGYVNGTISNVAVSNSDLGVTFDIGNQTTSLGGNTSNISDYGLVGYAKPQFTKNIGDETVNVYNSHVDQEEAAYIFAGSDEGWGGTISVSEIYSRLYDYEREDNNISNLPFATGRVKTRTIYKDTNDNITSINDELYDAPAAASKLRQWSDNSYPLRGKAVFNTTKEVYLWGSVKDTRTAYKEIEVVADQNAYCTVGRAQNDGNIQIQQNGNSYTITGATNEEETAHFKEDNKGFFYATINNRDVYIYSDSVPNNNNTELDLRASADAPRSGRYYFKKVGDNLRLYDFDGNQQSRGYLMFKGYNNFKVRGNNSDAAYVAQFGSSTTQTTLDESNYYPVERLGKTYLPLNVYDSNTIPEKDMNTFWNDRNLVPTAQNIGKNCPVPGNTAYITGGSRDYNVGDDYMSGYRFKRFSNYEPFRRSMNDSTSYNARNLQIITRTPDTNGFTFIEDQFNGSSSLSAVKKDSYFPHVTDWNRHRYQDLGLERYYDSRTSFDNLCKSISKPSFMRFNGHNISMDDIIEADSVVLNRRYLTNYQLPESAIDFSVAEKGVINMFSSGFRGSNEGDACEGFCSFYQVSRDSSLNITGFKRIKAIYTNPHDDGVVYRFFTSSTSSSVENRYFKYTTEVDPITHQIISSGYVESASLPSGYTLKFDFDWLENPGFNKSHRACYYFEWPVSPGEYAIAAVPGKQTAYMSYLDIGASAKMSQRTSVYQKFTVQKKEYTIPEGVFFISELDEDLTNNKTLCLKLKQGFTGVLSMSGTSTVTELSRYDSYTELNYKDYDMIVKKAGQDPPLDVVATYRETTTVERLTIIDHLNDNTETSFVITETRTSVNGGSANLEREAIMIDAAGNEDEYLNDQIMPQCDEITDVLFDMWFYYLDDDTIEVNVGFSKVLDESNEEEIYYLVENILVDIDSTSDLEVHVVALDEEGTYGLVINGELVSTISVVDVPAE